jgi:hypothetical protein
MQQAQQLGLASAGGPDTPDTVLLGALVVLQEDGIFDMVLRVRAATVLIVAELSRLKRVSKAWRSAVKRVLADSLWLWPALHQGVEFVEDFTSDRAKWLGNGEGFQDRMQAFTLDAAVQHQAIDFLCYLLNTKAYSFAFKQRAVVLVLQALRAHPAHDRVQQCAFRCLGDIAWCSSGQDALREGGAIEHLMAMLGRAVSPDAVDALRFVIAVPYSANAANLRRATAAGAGGLVARTMTANADTESVQLACIKCLKRLSGSDATLFAQTGCAQPVVECMRRFPHSPALQKHAVKLLALLQGHGSLIA